MDSVQLLQNNRAALFFRNSCLTHIPSKSPQGRGAIRFRGKIIADARIITDFVDRPYIDKEECYAKVMHFALANLAVSLKRSESQHEPGSPFWRYDIDAPTMELVKKLGIAFSPEIPASEWCFLKGGAMLKASANSTLTNGLILPENSTVQLRMHAPRVSEGGKLVSGKLGVVWWGNPILGGKDMAAPYNAPFRLMEQVKTLLEDGKICSDIILNDKIFESTMQFLDFLEKIMLHSKGRGVKIVSPPRPTVVYERDINPIGGLAQGARP